MLYLLSLQHPDTLYSPHTLHHRLPLHPYLTHPARPSHTLRILLIA
ncbi:hypothetical protein E2C01_099270 [Portunus trituberculatus]|uniref:Uncharacterized protein n=1 Tax=Portunus trituberculatus TaxID=210409 RepID=A0A5B7KEH1_PORTR|nr:hypothetical protein [Portunus trituberculatus]